jgi:tetratricopeptide (TPR) repeat protein
MSEPSESPQYFAFVSYSHQDQRWADWLHKSLETYRVPSRLVGMTTSAGKIPRRLLPIFRDRDELASSSDLGRTVNAALAQSRNLIVICSPASAQSRWVNEEVLAFKRLGGSDRIFCFIVGGEPNASGMPGREAEECFAPALRYKLAANGQPTTERTEPIAADAREGKDGRGNAKLKLVAGMLDVGFDALKQRELQRRNRRMALITAAALVIMAVTTTLAITAVIARHDAERRQKQAEDLVNFMVGDLYDKLREVQRLDILETAGDKAMAYFRSLPTSDVNEEALEQRAKALEEIATVRLDQGHIAEAMESFQEALKLSRPLAETAPGDSARQVAYSRLLAFVGKAYWYQGKLDGAQQSFESAQKVLEHVQTTGSSDPELLFQVTVLDNNIGHVMEARGLLDEAAARYQAMLKNCEQLVAGRQAKPSWLSQLGTAHNNLGKLALMRGDLATSIAEYSADDAIETRLSDQDPRNNNQLTNTFTVRAILGRTLALTGAVAGARQRFEQAIEMGSRVRAADPTATDVQENLALYQMQLSRLLRLSGELGRAVTLTSEALETFGKLTKQEPTNSDWQREFAEVRIERGAQSMASGNLDAARKDLQAGLGILDPALAKRPGDRNTLLPTANSRLLLAAVTVDADIARTLREAALEAMGAVKSGSNDPRLRALQVAAMLGLGRRSEAEPVIKNLWESGYRDLQLVELLARERIDYPVNTAFQQHLEENVRKTITASLDYSQAGIKR